MLCSRYVTITLFHVLDDAFVLLLYWNVAVTELHYDIVRTVDIEIDVPRLSE